MSVIERLRVIKVMKRYLDGVVGSWAFEASTFISCLENNALNMSDADFHAYMCKWEKLLSQAPASVTQNMIGV